MNGAEVLLMLFFGAVSLVIGGFAGIRYGMQQAKLQHEEQMRREKENAEARLLDLQQQQRDALRESKDETAKIRAALEAEARERRQEMKRQEQRTNRKRRLSTARLMPWRSASARSSRALRSLIR